MVGELRTGGIYKNVIILFFVTLFLSLEGVVSEAVVVIANLPSIELHLSLISSTCPGNFEFPEPSIVADDLKHLARVVVDHHLKRVYVAEDRSQERGHVQRQLVRGLVGGHQALHDDLIVSPDLGLHVHLAEHDNFLIHIGWKQC